MVGAQAYPPHTGSGDGFHGGCVSLPTLHGKWWWVHGGCAKLTHPTGEVAMGFMVGAQVYPPYKGSSDGFMVGA